MRRSYRGSVDSYQGCLDRGDIYTSRVHATVRSALRLLGRTLRLRVTQLTNGSATA